MGGSRTTQAFFGYALMAAVLHSLLAIQINKLASPPIRITYTEETQRPPRFIFGHSTGHSGSTTAHMILKQDGCTFKMNGNFERIPRKMLQWSHDPECGMVRKDLKKFHRRIPKNETYIDLGHFYNRGRIWECLADMYGRDVHILHIRRNRHQIAYSFAKHYVTPCISSKQSHPYLAICPYESDGAGPANLPVVEKVWNQLTPFQRFLWYADEVEHRWYTLQRDYKQPSYSEITWSTGDELQAGLRKVRESWGCSITADVNYTLHEKKHVEHKVGTLNCSGYIRQDLEYRKLMDFDEETSSILYQHPQRVLDDEECMDSLQDLQKAIDGANSPSSSWVLPSTSEPSNILQKFMWDTRKIAWS